MTLQQIEYIVALAEYGQFVAAADALGVNQSTLSLMVKKLEEELDVQIFDRSSHPIRPTSIGQKLIDKAMLIQKASMEMVDLPKTTKELMSGKLSIATISTVAPILIPGIFKYFMSKWPSISLTTEEMLSETIVEKLERAEVDMGIMCSPVDRPSLLEIPLYTEPFLAYVSPQEPIYSQEEIERSSIFDHPIWIINKGIRLFDESLLDKGEKFTYETMYEGGRVGILLRIVNENGGLTIIPQTQAGLILYSEHANIKRIVNPVPTRTVSLVIRRDFIREKLLNEVAKCIKEIIPQELLSDFVLKGNIRL